MRKLTTLIVLALLPFGFATASDKGDGHWFYMVKTKPTDYEREDQFNAWYDDIDIPDVLAVPSFKRAQRAVGLNVEHYQQVDVEEREGKYVALYDIESQDIDKSIIDLYVAARKMSAFGRSTDLLKVVEANYYQRLLHVPKTNKASGKNTYFYMQKVNCCDDTAAGEKMLRWVEKKYLPAMHATKGLQGSRFYELYRVMEDWALPEEELPHFLIIHEVIASSEREAVEQINAVQNTVKGFKKRVTGDITLYKRMSDVKSK